MRTVLSVALLLTTLCGTTLAQNERMDEVGRMLDETGKRIEAAVEAGQISEADAWEEWYTLRDDILQDAQDTGQLNQDEISALRREVGKVELRERLDYEGRMIKDAFENGEMGEKEAWEEWFARRDALIEEAVESGTISQEEAAQYGKGAGGGERSDLDRKMEEAGNAIKQAAMNGEITGEEAWEKWYETKEQLINDAVDSGELSLEDAREYHREIYKAELSERLQNAGAEIREDFAAGALTEEQAWAEWDERKEDLINTAVDLGEIDASTATDFRRGIEKAEVGQKIKSAINKGEITEEEGRVEWEDYLAEAEERWATEDALTDLDAAERELQEAQEELAEVERQVGGKIDGDNLPNDEWAQYVKAFIVRYELDDAQQQRAWRSYRTAKQQDERVMQRLQRAGSDRNDERSEANAQRAAEMHERLFERMKAELDRLPTRTQRRQNGE